MYKTTFYILKFMELTRLEVLFTIKIFNFLKLQLLELFQIVSQRHGRAYCKQRTSQ